jgi:hypothetical protein
MDEGRILKEKSRRSREVDLLRQAANAVVAKDVLRQGTKVSGFLAMVGERYSSELMVVGRATNGWRGGQQLSSETIEDFVDKALLNAICCGPGGQTCPLRWVTDLWGTQRASSHHEDYSTARSAFWRVIKLLTARLKVAEIAEDSWPSHLVWTNLYKIAPTQGGNPSNRLCDAQLEACASLLKAEFQIYAPKRVVFLTGRDWADPFWAGISPQHPLTVSDSGPIEATGRLELLSQRTQVVIAKHPQGKNGEEWVRCVAAAFEKAN